MDPASLRSGLERIAADLTVAGEPVPFDLVIERHLRLFSQARAAGLRASSMARLLAQAGARRPDGTPFSADQLRASLSRARSRQAIVNTDLPPVDVPRPTPARAVPPRPPRLSAGREAPTAEATTSPLASSVAAVIGSDPDMSDAELRLARERLRRL
jgi:hypothetical protein